MSEVLWEGIPRREIPWRPTINYDVCNGCQACMEHCPGDVYDWDEAQSHPVVARPLNCVIYCMGCAKACPEDAITFPVKDEVVALVKQLRARYAA